MQKLEYSVLLGAILADSKMANHLSDVSDFYIIKLREIPENLIVEGDSSAMRCAARIKAFGAVLQHAFNVTVGHADRH